MFAGAGRSITAAFINLIKGWVVRMGLYIEMRSLDTSEATIQWSY